MNPRFQDYVTSGAFSLTLTRAQISALSSMVGGEDCISSALGGLERRGLVEAIGQIDPARTQWRLTGAGSLALALIAEAGLSNRTEPMAAEIDALRGELAKAREIAADARVRAWSAMARKDAADLEIKALRAEIASLRDSPLVRLKPGVGRSDRAYEARPFISRRDHHPGLSDDELMAPFVTRDGHEAVTRDSRVSVATGHENSHAQRVGN